MSLLPTPGELIGGGGRSSPLVNIEGKSAFERELGGLARFTSGFFRGIVELGKLPFTTAGALSRGEPIEKLPPILLTKGILNSFKETGADLARVLTTRGRKELAEKIDNSSIVEVVGEDAINILGTSRLISKPVGSLLGRTPAEAEAITRALATPTREAMRFARRRIARPAFEAQATGAPVSLPRRIAANLEARAIARQSIRPTIVEATRSIAAAKGAESVEALRVTMARVSAQLVENPAMKQVLREVDPRLHPAVVQKAVGQAVADIAQGKHITLAHLPPQVSALPEAIRGAFETLAPATVDPALDSAIYAARKEIVTNPSLRNPIIAHRAQIQRVSEDILSLGEEAKARKASLARPGRVADDDIQVGPVVFSRSELNGPIRRRLGRADSSFLARDETGYVVPVEAIGDHVRTLMESGDLTAKARRIIQRTFNPRTIGAPITRVEARLQPMVRSFNRMADDYTRVLEEAGIPRKEARAQALREIAAPERLEDVMQFAIREGWDPIYVPDLSPQQVRKGIMGHPYVSDKPLRDIGQTVETSRLKRRRQILTTQGRVERSWEAWAAAMTEVTMAERSNAVAQFVNGISFDIPKETRLVQGVETVEKVLPEGWVAYDPSARAAVPVEGNIVRQGHITKMVPKKVMDELKRWEAPGDPSGVFRGYDKVTDAWRTAVLTVSPRWYVNNTLGNMVVGTLQGVTLRDFVSAWRSLRKGGMSFAEARRAPEGFTAAYFPGRTEAGARLGASTLVNIENIRGPLTRGIVRPGTPASAVVRIKDGLDQLASANQWIDTLARTAGFESLVRKGMNVETALRQANRMFVDYLDMTPWQRAYVRRIVPFFTWQQGILKLALRLPIDHPLRVATFYQFGKTLGGFTESERENYPAFMFHSIPFGDGRLMTRGVNPLADSLSLVTPDGILSSINPVAEWFIRGIFHTPQEDNPFMQKLRVTEGGFLQPEYDWFREGLLVFRDLPINRLAINALQQSGQLQLGGYRPPVQRGPTSLAAEFFGFRVRSPEEITRAIERTAEARETAAGSLEAEARRRMRRQLGITATTAGAQSGLLPTPAELLGG
jgi:hypothetical protein